MMWSFHPYDLPLARPYSWAKGTEARRRGLLVACSVEGATGWGEVAPPPHHDTDPVEMAAFARRTVRAIPLAADLPAALDEAGTGPRLRCGLAGAWLDAQARLEGVPLAALLARRACPDAQPAAHVPVNALLTAGVPAGVAQQAREAVAHGFSTLKAKSSGDPGADAACMAAVRAAVGPAPRLRLDANESYGPAAALDALRRLEPFGLEYVEQPVPAARRDAIALLLAESPVPIALDESATSWPAVSAFAGLRPVLVAKPQRLGGPDRAAAFVARAGAAGLRCVVTNSLETAVGRAHALHVAALLPQPAPACGLATGGWLAHDVARLEARAGWMEVPRGPGLGLDADLEALHAPALG